MAMAPDRSRWVSLAAGLAFGLALMGPIAPAASFTDKQAREIFATLGPDSNGHVSRVQFEQTKLNAFYFRHRPTGDYEMKPLTFEETDLSREFFDKADTDHDGTLDGVEIVDAIRFEDIDTKGRGYFDFSDLVAFLKKIGR
jgi:Ca2+-binding EF-hand superfamily protein